MASSFTSNKETTNYARLCRLLADVGTQVLRETFDKIHPPGSLHTVLTTAPVNAKLTSMKKMKAINPTQWAALTSPTVSSEDFDITLLVALLRNICGLAAPLTAWLEQSSKFHRYNKSGWYCSYQDPPEWSFCSCQQSVSWCRKI